MTTLKNLLNQALDIAGSVTHSDSMSVSDESSLLGAAVSGQSGAAASVGLASGGVSAITGLTGMDSALSPGRFLTISGGATGANNGTFLIVTVASATEVGVANASAVADANNGSISWVERKPYSIEDDMNYTRSDRAAIKGVAYDASVPTYNKTTDQVSAVSANLSNIAGKTTDAKSFVVNRKANDVTVASTNTLITITDTGNMKHADSTDLTGVPVDDGQDSGNDGATYVEIVDNTGSGLYVLAGGDAGKRIFGRTNAGSATSPNSVEVEFRAVAEGADLSSSVAYTWEASQPTTVDMFYGFRESLDSMDENALRTVMISGIVSDAGLANSIADIRETIGMSAGDTDLNAYLTNTGNFFAFTDLPDGSPSVVEALNTLNSQIGNRDFTSSILTDGETVTESLEALAAEIAANSGLNRTVERLASAVTAGSSHTLPGGLTYTVDGTDNGANLYVFWRGLLRDPGEVGNGDDYEEASTTAIKPFSQINSGDHINYITFD